MTTQTLYTIKDGFNRSAIMCDAWEKFRRYSQYKGRELTFAQALKMAWHAAKCEQDQKHFSAWKAANAERANQIAESVRRVGTLQQPLRPAPLIECTL